jgi:hypothetical protein
MILSTLGWSRRSLFLVPAILAGVACGSSSNPGFDELPSGSSSSGGSKGHDASTSSSGSSGGSSSGTPGNGSSGGDDTTDDSGSVATDDASGDDAADDAGDDADDDDADDGSSDDASSHDAGTSPQDSGKPAYTCNTGLSPAPVCDTQHHYCLCTADAECNSASLTVGQNKGGCNSGKCAAGKCTGNQNKDSAGCAIVGPVCNLPGQNNACPSGTACEMNHGNCGGAVQCCWCTSDSACPVSGKCINDPTTKQCGDGGAACTGTGTDWDGMHCALAAPGLPLCSMP